MSVTVCFLSVITLVAVVPSAVFLGLAVFFRYLLYSLLML